MWSAAVGIDRGAVGVMGEKRKEARVQGRKDADGSREGNKRAERHAVEWVSFFRSLMCRSHRR